MTTDHEKYKNEARKQWNNNPCGATLGDQQTLEYFKSVEVARYKEYAPWMKRFYGFSEHRGLKLLEIGFGQGTDLVQFAEGGAICYGVDITQKHFELATQNFKLRGLKADLILNDANNLYPMRMTPLMLCIVLVFYIILPIQIAVFQKLLEF